MAKKESRTCIQEFIQYVDALAEEEDPEGNGFNREYRLIHEVQVRNRREQVFEMNIGKTEANLRKNRYKDILPYDEHRVVLSKIEGDPDSDYINASRIKGVKGTGGYIASQGPLAATVDDFWRMIWEYNVEIIFMACRIVEMGKIKCKQYWNDVGQSEVFGDITVYTETEEEISSDFIQRKFRVVRGETERSITQFHYSGWPDHGIPEDPAHIRDLIGIMRGARQDDAAPLLVHCSAGCGRTGAIVAIDFVWTLLEEGKFDESFSLFDLICSFREKRMSMVQTPEQYALVNKVLKALCEEWLQKMASHTYVNVELNQECVKIGDRTNGKPDPTENVYEDLKEETPHTPQNTSNHENMASDEGPEIVNLPLPSKSNKTSISSNYENITLPHENKAKERAPPAAPIAGQNPSDKQVHKTVIQVGASSPAPKRQDVASSGENKEVINFVDSDRKNAKLAQPQPPKPVPPPSPVKTTQPPPVKTTLPPPVKTTLPPPTKTTLPPPTKTTLPPSPKKTAAPTVASIAPPLPNMRMQPPLSPSSPRNFKPDSPIKKEAGHSSVSSSSHPAKPQATRLSGGPELTAEPVYAQVNKPHGSSRRASDNAISPGIGYGVYDEVQPKFPVDTRPNSAGNNPKIDVSGRRPNGSSTGVSMNARQLSGNPPGFKERLPRVKGPVPAPSSWGNI